MGVKLANDASTTLAAAIGASDTALTLAAGTGARFPSLDVGDWFPATIEEGNSYEIVRVTARSSDTLTVSRGQEGTGAQSFGIGARLDCRATVAALTELQGVTGVFTESVASIMDESGITPGEYLLEPWATGPGTYTRLRARVKAGTDDATFAVLLNGSVELGPYVVEAGTPLEEVVSLDFVEDDEVTLALLSTGAGDIDWLIVKLDSGAAS